jgi:hypothetical protein
MTIFKYPIYGPLELWNTMAIFTQEGQKKKKHRKGGSYFLTLATGKRHRSWLVLAFQFFKIFQDFSTFNFQLFSSCFPVVPRNIIGNCNDAALLKRLVETLGFQHMDLEVTGPRVSWIDKAIDSH